MELGQKPNQLNGRPILTTQASTLYCLSLAQNRQPLCCELPLFFCVRAISFSISDIFSKIPMAAAVASRRYTQNRNEDFAVAENCNRKEKKKMKLKREYASKMCATVVGKSRHTKRQNYENTSISLQWSDLRASAIHTAAIDIFIRVTNLNETETHRQSIDGFSFKNIYIYFHTVPCTLHNIQFSILFNKILYTHFIRRCAP